MFDFFEKFNHDKYALEILITLKRKDGGENKTSPPSRFINDLFDEGYDLIQLF